MFAYVQYCIDKVRTIVSVNEIKNFHPQNINDFKKGHLYDVFWSPANNADGSFYEAHVLKLEESKEALETAIKKKRMTCQILNIAGSHHEEQGKMESTMPALKDKVKSAKSTERDILKRKMHVNEVKEDEEIKKMKQDLLAFKTEISMKDATIKTLTIQVESASSEIKKLTTLNRQLQEQLLKILMKEDDCNREKQIEESCRKNFMNMYEEYNSSLPKMVQTQYPAHDEPMVLELPIRDDYNSSLPEMVQTQYPAHESIMLQLPIIGDAPSTYKNDTIPKTDDDLVDIGCEIKMNKKKWEAINCLSNNSSNFVKRMALAIWGDDALAMRSVYGRPSNKMKNIGLAVTPFPPLTPEKVHLIKGFLRKRLETQVSNPQILEKEVNKVPHYITEKIHTIRRGRKGKDDGSSDTQRQI